MARQTAGQRTAAAPAEQQPGAGTRLRLVPAALSIALVLFAPIPAFFSYNDWSGWSADSLIALLIALAIGFAVTVAPWMRRRVPHSILLAGALAYYLDFQVWPVESDAQLLLLVGALAILPLLLYPHLPAAVALMFGIMAALSMVPERRISVPPPVDLALPPVVYLMLDAHLSPADLADSGREAAIKERVRSLYVDRGFRLIESAFSHFDHTADSIPTALNGSLYGESFAVEKKFGFRMPNTRVFEDHLNRGYQIVVYHPRYLDPCPEGGYCLPYSSWGLRAHAGDRSWTSSDRFRGWVGALTSKSNVLTGVRWRYNGLRKRLGLASDWPTPTLTGAASSMWILDHAQELLESEPRGRLLYAHLLDPHAPYTHNSDCSRTPISTWRHPMTGGREEYLNQLECLLGRLERFLDTALEDPRFADATIVVHGDHGPRIDGMRAIEHLQAAQRDAADLQSLPLDPATTQAFRDRFLTMLAIRSPSTSPGLDSQPWSLQQGLALFWGWTFTDRTDTLHAGPTGEEKVEFAVPERWHDDANESETTPADSATH